jgi:hypothetical protein
MVFVFLPETVRREKVEMLTSDNESSQEIVHKTEKFRALQNLKAAFAPMVAMLGDPTILIITLYSTVIFCCLYFLVCIVFSFVMALNTHYTHRLLAHRHLQLQRRFRGYTVTPLLWWGSVISCLGLA